MTTVEIAEHLVRAAAEFPFLGIREPKQLLEVVRLELGDVGALDDFVPYGGHSTMARGPATILHVISGNTPHAGLQSLIRGLLLKAHNLCKIPGTGLPEVSEFRPALPSVLAERVEISTELSDEWLTRAEVVIAFGADATINAIRRRLRPEQLFIPHGHKLSFGIVFDDPVFESTAGAARDASLFDQQGCLSPHLFYVAGDVRAYAKRLAAEMEKFNAHTPRARLSAEESAAIATLRDEYEFRAASDSTTAVFKSAGTTEWTVILTPETEFRASCLNRVVFVQPLPRDFPTGLATHRQHMSACGIFPVSMENARVAASAGVTRICAIGEMQSPPFTWHQDGGQTLAPLVHWIDFEPEQS